MRLIRDIQDMPGFHPAVKDNVGSVTQGFVGVSVYHGEPFPVCPTHGAMLRVSKSGIWRCMVCHVGCWSPP